jgi:F-type H+-transporting ATPase subunit epsilon
MEKKISVEIITPSKSAYKGEVKSVTLPGTVGSFQVLFNHAPILSSLEIGRIKIEELDEKVVEFATGGGTVEIRDNKVLVLVDSVESASEIDVERAKNSYQRAKERLSIQSQKQTDIARAEASLHRAMNRMKLAGHSF